MLIETGARYGELRQATWGDLDVTAATLRFRPETTKTGASRLQPLTESALASILALPAAQARVLRRQPGPSDPIFLTPRGKPLRREASNFRDDFLAECYVRAGILARNAAGKVTWRDANGRMLGVHTMRRTMVNRLHRANVPTKSGMMVTGHRSEAVYHSYCDDDVALGHAALAQLPALPVTRAGATQAKAKSG